MPSATKFDLPLSDLRDFLVSRGGQCRLLGTRARSLGDFIPPLTLLKLKGGQWSLEGVLQADHGLNHFRLDGGP